ncbi:MAG: hypothetical protein GY747_07705 [Planctomycetes bacterium]|nr:hypothetical protein [Planctomycetota bacterium]MCP4772112.1 hypothetical protein [Planctomycetota bacterium]MCP4862207.1 hypothetical protein [Planctomycetota bacterium]
MFKAYILPAVFVFLVAACAAPKSSANRNAPPDWLLNQGSWQAEVLEQDDQLILQNGLIKRVIKLSPNAATIAFENLMTGESMLRSPKPEALVTLDGMDLAVGGLSGQPDHAFLLPEWVGDLKDDPASFHYVGHRIGQTKEAFGWKRNRHSEGRPWPAPGASLEMDYRLNPSALAALQDRLASPNAQRETLLHETFQDDDGSWSFLLSNSDERNSVINEGKFGEIYARANSFAFMQRDLPAATQVVECQLDAGTDASASWGPGMVLIWPEGHTVKILLRPGQKQFGVNVNGSERTFSGLDVAKSWWLRVELRPRGMVCLVSSDRKQWRELMVVKDGPNVAPSMVRLGKTDRSGSANDFPDIGELGRSRLLNFSAHGQLSGTAIEEMQSKLQRLAKVTITIRYEIFDGIPLLGKELLVHNGSGKAVQLERFTSELLAAVEAESRVEGAARWRPAGLDVVSDYAFGGMSPINSSKVVHWVPDPEYMTQVNYQRLSPVLLEARLPAGPDVPIASGETFRSFRVFELAQDSTDRERKGLARRQMYRTIAPWVTENPLMMHIRSADPTAVKLALDQCEAVGFEMAILTFGSGFNIESEDPAYLAQLKELADYAHERGIQLGGYSLLASRRISKQHDVVDKETGETGHAFFGNSPCLESEWGQEYFQKLYDFYEKTGFDLLEHDGSYPGDFCASTSHPGHSGYDDSQWLQWVKIRDFYQWCREQGVFLNVPDFYVLAGSNKTGMGYRETNWSLPRAWQPLHGRQNVYDGTWEKTPTMGWMFVPLTQYQGGGAAATIEPLKDHLDAYESHLAYNLGFGVQACWRGPRLFDSPQTEALVKKWVDFYKQHRAILESDLLHLRRADGRDLDYMMHVNPRLGEKALLMVFNPLAETRTKTIRVPLYYTGLSTTTKVSQEGATFKRMKVNRDYSVGLEVTVPPQSQTWFVFQE